MGVYDTLIDGERQIQVKCFNCEFETYEVGDKVPIEGTFVIMFPSSDDVQYASIEDGIFIKLTDQPPAVADIIDKWGRRLDSYEDFKDPFEEVVS